MKNITRKTRDFFKSLHDDESGPGTVEWVLMVIVALIVMAAIYYIARWVLAGSGEQASDVDEQVGKADTDADKIATDLGVSK